MADLINDPLVDQGHIIPIDPTGKIVSFNCGTVHSFYQSLLAVKYSLRLIWSTQRLIKRYSLKSLQPTTAKYSIYLMDITGVWVASPVGMVSYAVTYGVDTLI